MLTSFLFMFWYKDFWIILLIVYILGKSEHLIEYQKVTTRQWSLKKMCLRRSSIKRTQEHTELSKWAAHGGSFSESYTVSCTLSKQCPNFHIWKKVTTHMIHCILATILILFHCFPLNYKMIQSTELYFKIACLILS